MSKLDRQNTLVVSVACLLGGTSLIWAIAWGTTTSSHDSNITQRQHIAACQKMPIDLRQACLDRT